MRYESALPRQARGRALFKKPSSGAHTPSHLDQRAHWAVDLECSALALPSTEGDRELAGELLSISNE